MWTWTLNWDEIRDDLVIGSCPMTTADIDRIRIESGVSALLSVQHDECRSALGIDYEQHRHHGGRLGLHLVNAPMRDFDVVDQRRGLPAAVASLNTLLDAGHRVYVHCTAGINRSPLTVLGYLTYVEGMTPEAASELISDGRPQAEPYWDAYHGCRTDLTDRHRAAINRRAKVLWLRDPGLGSKGARLQAETEIIRREILKATLLASSRLDPRGYSATE